MSRLIPTALGLLILALTPCPALSCSLCVNIKQTPTLRQEAAHGGAKLILYGHLANPKLKNDIAGAAGTTEFIIRDVLRADSSLTPGLLKRKGDVILLGSYVPIEDVKNPPQYLLFVDVASGRLDPYRAVPVTSARTAQYLRQALSINPRDTRKALHFFFDHLDHPDRDVSSDAFMEFARTPDREIGEVARELSPVKLRRWLKAPTTPEERLGLYTFLLGRCGDREDVTWFRATLDKPGERFSGAYDGLLGGYIQLRPREGWEMAEKIMREGRQPLPLRLAVARMLRFYQAWKAEETRPVMLKILGAMLVQGELSDLAVEDLRRGKLWDLTEKVLALYGRRGLDAPIHKRAILRYALSCPLPSARQFVVEVRKRETELVREVEQSLRVFEQK